MNKYFLRQLPILTFILLTVLPVLSFAQWTPVNVGDTGLNTWGFSTVGMSIVSKDTIYISGSSRRFWKSFDGGEHWEFDSSNSGCSTEHLQFLNAKTGWRQSENCIGRTSDGGKSWIDISPAINLPFNTEFTSMFFTDSLTGWVGTRYLGILSTTDGGSTWSIQRIANETPRNWEFKIGDIKFRDRLHGIAIGYYNIFLTTTNGGATWNGLAEPDSIPSGPKLSALSFPSEQRAYATASSRYVFRSTNAGVTWNYQSVDTSQGAVSLYDIFFLDSLTGWAVGSKTGVGGVIHHTSDGGLTWLRDFIFNEGITDVAFLDSATGFALSNRGWILKFTPTLTTVRSIGEPGLNVSAVWQSGQIRITLPVLYDNVTVTFYDLLGRKLHYEEAYNKNYFEIHWKGSVPIFISIRCGDVQKVLQVYPY